MVKAHQTPLLLLVSLILMCSVIGIGADDPPPISDLAKTARYIVHKADWCTMTTISSQPLILGHAFSSPTSISDGTIATSTGIPYFYHANMSYVVEDISKDSKVTLSFSEAAFGLKNCIPGISSDPEYPLCARLTIMGNMKLLTDPGEIATAKEALFPRHPDMASWHKAHTFVFLKLDITRLLIIDFFGGWNPISVEDYFNVKM